MLRTLAVVVILALAGGRELGARSRPADDDVIHALNRLTYGPRPGDVERVKAIGLNKWIDEQLSPAKVDDATLAARLARLETLTLDPQTIMRDYAGPAMEERKQRKLQNANADPDAEPANKMPPSDVQRKDRAVLTDLEEAKLLRAVYSDHQLEEVLVDFWFNHFNVFAGKGPVREYASDYEREAIRPHVFGKFRDMLGATAKHPAMLFYLDNWQSKVGGINENYARELLELHTLGVDGGYTQNDIMNVARAFTGWTMRPRMGTGFVFVARQHDQGEKIVLGQKIRGGGIDDGERVLDIVAAHPSTAHHIAKQLAMRFVSDDPPAALVDRAAATFTRTKGDLREVVRTIITSPEFMSADARRAKVKTPFEFVASALRATGAEVRNAVPIAKTLKDMGMPLYFCQPPTGYDEVASAWVSAGALVSRMNFAVDLSKNQLRGVRVPLSEEQTLALKIGAPEFQRQ